MKFSSLPELTEWVLQSRCLWLFLDYDGTLVEFSPTPAQVELHPEAIHVLQRLARLETRRLAIVSGRSMEDIRRLVPVDGIFLAGTYGLELFTPDGELINRVDYASIRPILERVKADWRELIGDRPGFYLEDKGCALALHARYATQEDARHVLTAARQAITPASLGDLFNLVCTSRFLEIAPFLANKKEAVLYLLAHYPFPGARLLYIGDDDRDEEAYPAIQAHQGAAVKVTSAANAAKPTRADFLFSSPAETLRWLERL
jgi:trehalose 6-phosphate phosphatase